MKHKTLLCSLSLLFCLTAAMFAAGLSEPKQRPPQTLLTEREQQELVRLPKPILEATEGDLMLVEGVGRQRAAAILQYLNNHELESMEQLLEVEGIGEDTLKAIKKYFYLF